MQEQEENINIGIVLRNYLQYWYWILLSMFVFSLAAFIYLKGVSNTYSSQAKVLVKDSDKGGLALDVEVFSDLGIGTGNTNVYNEIEVFKSRPLIEDVVKDLGLQVRYIEKGGFVIKDKHFYNDSPFKIELNPDLLDSLSQSINFTLKFIDNKNFIIFQTYSNEVTKHHDKLGRFKINQSFNTKIGEVRVVANNALSENDRNVEFVIKIATRDDAVNYIFQNLDIEAVSKDVSIINISHRGYNTLLNNDIVNSLIKQHQIKSISDKNELTQKTSEFIKERMLLIEQELDGIEDVNESYKLKHRLIDVASDAASFMQRESSIEGLITQASIQYEMTKLMSDFISENPSLDELLPANLGLEDNGISKLTTDYNALVLERNKLAQNSGPKNPMVINYDAKIISMRGSLASSLDQLKKSQKNNIQLLRSKESEYKGKLAKIPVYEKNQREIQRQQQIKETLYLYLLQKREENEIALASTLGTVTVIEPAYSNRKPISPKKKLLFLGALLIGLVIPFLILYIRDLLDLKVRSKNDLEHLNLPILVEVPNNDTDDYVVVFKGSRSVIAEAFRVLRTNMSFILPKTKSRGKTIFCSSTIAGEGKTFSAINLAHSLALSNHKVILVGMDLRVPKLVDYLELENQPGVTNYLINDDLSIEDITFSISNDGSELDCIISGSIPPNPSELLTRSKVDDFFNVLKERYDYVIVDTAPVAAITDTMIIAHHADLFLFVVRANYLNKIALEVVDKLNKEKQLNNIGLLLNGVKKRGSTFKGYGYGYGYGYGAETKKSFIYRLFRK